jgi:signal transduction histidine kinase
MHQYSPTRAAVVSATGHGSGPRLLPLPRPGAEPTGGHTCPPAPEHERLVIDLHDLIIPGLSRLGFELAAAGTTVDGIGRDRITAAIRHVDELIGDLRGLLLNRLDRSTGQVGLEATLRDLVGQAGAVMGCAPRLQVEGDLDRLSPRVAHHLRAVVAEASLNAVTHSRGTHLEVRVVVGTDEVGVEVADDGDGPPAGAVHGIGLGSMAARARELGGTFGFGPGPCTGALVEWRVPLVEGPGPSSG